MTKLQERLATFRKRCKRFSRCNEIFGMRARHIFICGPLAGVTYGIEVHGASNCEMQSFRRATGAAMKPSTRMRSLSCLLQLESAPAWFAAVAPMLRYSNEVWANQVRFFSFSRSFQEIRESREAAFGDGFLEPNWGQVRGPLGAARLSLKRIDWSMDCRRALKTILVQTFVWPCLAHGLSIDSFMIEY